MRAKFVLLCAFLILSLIILPASSRQAEPAPAGGSGQPGGNPQAAKPAKQPPAAAAATADEKPVHITEEIEVTAKVPREKPISSQTVIQAETIRQLAPRDISEALSYSSGAVVTTGGGKNESYIKIRGLDNQRITLLYDGVPVYEPYFNSFNLKSIPSEAVETIKVVKGASSVLYGPNAMGGVIDVVSKRPAGNYLSFRGNYGSFKFGAAGLSGAYAGNKFSFLGSAYFDRADEYQYHAGGEKKDRFNSDYQRYNLAGKFYFYPVDQLELLTDVSYYNSTYGIPPAVAYSNPRYWDFKDWDRFTIASGGTYAFERGGYLKFRGYYNRYFNVLDAFTSAAMTSRQWESTYKNRNYGFSAASALPQYHRQTFRLSFNVNRDEVRTQEDLGKTWEQYDHTLISTGLEDHLAINDQWTLVGGFSVDTLWKNRGRNKTTFNPLAGIKYSPEPDINLHFSVSQKSRFPSMKNLYSTSGGNPDLRDERGTNVEWGASWEGPLHLEGAVFYNRIKDLIEVVRLPSGYKTNYNVGKARLAGFELSVGKAFEYVNFTFNYTWLDGENLNTGAGLDMMARHQFNSVINFTPTPNWNIGFWGVAFTSQVSHFSNFTVHLPGYAVCNAEARYKYRQMAFYIRVENLLDHAYATEPGYPMPARSFMGGIDWRFDFK